MAPTDTALKAPKPWDNTYVVIDGFAACAYRYSWREGCSSAISSS